MKLFFDLLKLNLKIYFQYKWGFLVSFILDPIILILYISLLKTLYANDPDQLLLGYTCEQMIWYFAATKFFYYLVWSSPDQEISRTIITGEMITRFIKPISIMKWEFVKAIAMKISSFFFEFIPSILIFSLMVPPNFLKTEGLLMYLALSVFSFFLFFLISYFIATIAFLWQSNHALYAIKLIIVNVAAGAFIPLEFFPELLQKVIKALPFQHMFYNPVQFFLGKKTSLQEFTDSILTIIIWSIIFWGICSLSSRLLLKKFTAVGS